MALSHEAPRQVVYFDTSPRGTHITLIKQGIGQASWRGQLFHDPAEALDAMEGTSALITELGTDSSLFTTPLLERSDTLRIPRALLSDHPTATDFVRDDMLDILVPKSSPENISSNISSWLIRLAHTQPRDTQLPLHFAEPTVLSQ